MQALRVAAIAVIVVAVSPVRAQGTRVATVSTDKLWEAGGIARYLAARSQLDADKPKFKVVESPDGKKPPPVIDACKQPTSDHLKQLCKDLAKSQAEHQTSSEWDKHEHEVLDPIEADVYKALEAFVKARGIELLIDRDGEPAILYAAASLDITDAFIKDYNAKTKKR